jgi:hypothetical protein
MYQKWNDAANEHAQSIPATRLLAFVAPIRVKAECQQCGGNHTITCGACLGDGVTDCECRCGHSHEAACDECEDGKIKCPACTPAQVKTRAKFMGHIVNRELLRVILDVVTPNPDDAIDVAVLGTQQKEAYTFTGDGWRAILMPMAAYAEATADFDHEATW